MEKVELVLADKYRKKDRPFFSSFDNSMATRQEVETTLRQLKYVNWLVQKQSTFMYHQNQMMHCSGIYTCISGIQNHEGMTV